MSNYNFDNTRKEKKILFDNTRTDKKVDLDGSSTKNNLHKDNLSNTASGPNSPEEKANKLKSGANSSDTRKKIYSKVDIRKKTSVLKTSTESAINSKSTKTSNNFILSSTTKQTTKKSLNNEPQTPKRFDIKKVIYATITVIGIIIIIIPIVIFNSPSQKISRYLLNAKYSKAVNYYNEKVYGHTKKEPSADSLFFTYMDELADSYYADEIKYEVVSNAFSEFASLSKYKLKTYAQEKADSIKTNEDNKILFFSAEEQYTNKDYLSAMVTYITIPSTFYKSSICEEHYNSCRDILLKELPNPKTKADYLECINILDSYLENVNDPMFKARKKELESQYHNLYTSEITKTVDALLINGDYDQAFDVIAEAREIYDCKEFRELIARVYSLKEESYVTYSADDVSFINNSGSIANDNDVDIYTLDAQTEGIYGLTFFEMEYGFEVKVRVLNYLNEEVKSADISNNETLITGQIPVGKYTIEISHRNNHGSYEFSIGQPKPIIDINSYAVINDSLEFDSQTNRYSFTSEYAGTYRLEFSEILYDTAINVVVYDHLNTPVKETVVSTNSGLTLNSLIGGEKYTICISQYSGLTKYSLSIGRQKATKTAYQGEKVTGNIQFVDQNDLYIFTPSRTGYYSFTFYSDNWHNWYIKIYDSNNNPLSLTKDSEYHYSLPLDGKMNYTISCYYKDKLTPYSYIIGYDFLK